MCRDDHSANKDGNASQQRERLRLTCAGADQASRCSSSETGSVLQATLCGADAHPGALNHRVMPTVILVIQVGLASGGGWARLTPTVGPQNTGSD